MLLLCVLAAALAPAFDGGAARSNGLEGRAFHWRPALIQSGIFLGIQHSFRLATEPGTREELGGPFLRDYFRSVRAVRGWGDKDPFIVNYVGHPMMGAVTGFIQIQNDARGRVAVFGTEEYWHSRLRAMAWSTVFSLQFELGPLSEASIGNVGKEPGTMGMVDMVTTPVAGVGLITLEDVLDRYVVLKIERRTSNRIVRILVRSFLNPDRSFANVLRFKPPWHRDNRPGVSFRP
jgi:hypothetical protein